MNILTFDLEEWFHLLDFDATRGEEQWKGFEVRIYENTERILRLLDGSGSSATFFVIGWIAKTYPDLVRRISEKYEIGSHTDSHELVNVMGPVRFREDLKASKARLEDITGRKVEAFRAPGFSIGKDEKWALEILAEEEIKYDCSIFPARASHGGWDGFPANSPALVKTNSGDILEFPMSTHRIAGREIAFTGGGYFRLCPYPLLRKWSREAGDYLISYIHPRDLDAGQKVLPGLSAVRRFKSYYGLKGAGAKLRRYLSDFSFTDVRTAARNIDKNKLNTLEL
ncbi:MAG: polysaccharide deacetylase family protein [Bacteroidales bacterium]|nr:polysaccharide deacetylase family protein [Bacteroidales bacterium]